MIRPAASLLYPLTASVLVLSACIVFVCSISSSRMLTKTSYKLLQSGRLGDSPHLDERASERVSEWETWETWETWERPSKREVNTYHAVQSWSKRYRSPLL